MDKILLLTSKTVFSRLLMFEKLGFIDKEMRLSLLDDKVPYFPHEKIIDKGNSVFTVAIPLNRYYVKGIKTLNMIFIYALTNLKQTTLENLVSSHLDKNEKVMNDVISVTITQEILIEDNLKTFYEQIKSRYAMSSNANVNKVGTNVIIRALMDIQLCTIDNELLSNTSKTQICAFGSPDIHETVSTHPKLEDAMSIKVVLQDLFGETTYKQVIREMTDGSKNSYRFTTENLTLFKSCSEPIYLLYGIPPGFVVYQLTTGITTQHLLFTVW
jgi:hypothetical protein